MPDGGFVAADDLIDVPHYSAVRPENWRWPHFSPAEMACRGTGRLRIDTRLLDMLEQLRSELGDRPLIIVSGYRSPEHNARVGGAPRSQHLLGRAADISMANHDPQTFESAARRVGFRGIGLYPRLNFIHVDIGPPRTWGDPFPETASAADRFAIEPPKPPASRLGTVQASVVGVVTAAAAASDNVFSLVRSDAARETAAAVGGWAVNALAVVGFIALGLMIYRRLREWRRETEADEGGHQAVRG